MTRYIHGFELDLPPPKIAKRREHAVDFLISTYRMRTDDIALVPVGPMSNIATALLMAQDFVERVPEVVMMGGRMRSETSHLRRVSTRGPIRRRCRRCSMRVFASSR
jgi:inosine-uridine nucleoside N-ribohydrolase